MIYGYTIVYVDAVETTTHFYEKAFGFVCKLMTPEKDYSELLSGETTIAFASFGLGEANFPNGFKRINAHEKPVGVEMAFVTDRIEEDFQRAIDAGAQLVSAITQKPWGQRVAYVLDNNGFLIELCTPVG